MAQLLPRSGADRGRPKTILILAMEPLFPKVRASQERIYRMAERLARDHTVDVATTVRDPVELEQSREHLRAVCRAFHPITPINPQGSQLRRKLRRAEYLLLHAPRHHPHHYFYGGHRRVTAQVADIVRQNRYDIVQAEYWYMAGVFEAIDAGIFRAIDTHDVLFDKVRQEMARRHGDRLPARERRAQAKYRALEIAHLELADLVISISAADHETFIDLGLDAKTLLVPTGQDLDHFRAREPAERKDDVVLFYGNMGGRSNIDAFFRLWQDIFPSIKRAVPRARLLVVGANPPDSIRRLDDGREVTVTGFVEDVRDHLARAKVAVIPLEVAAGFRGRVVELMAMEIPLIGTHRALDCVQMQPGVHGFVTDSDAEMADHAARLLLDDDARVAMGARCRALAMARYSIDATIGKLSDYYLELPRPRDRQGPPSSR
jgi:glycosyltransferase involved in cell wall biosynthesis